MSSKGFIDESKGAGKQPVRILSVVLCTQTSGGVSLGMGTLAAGWVEISGTFLSLTEFENDYCLYSCE